VTPELSHIIKGCKQYQPREQEALYRLCYEPMMSVCMRYTPQREQASELYNQSMLKVFRSIGQYEQKGVFMGWVRRIVVNTCIDHCRREVKYSIRAIDDEEELNIYIQPEAENKIAAEDIINWMQELPKNTGLVFNLFAIEGYRHDEIAEHLGISTGTTKWHVNEARRQLQLKFKNYQQTEIKNNVI
jgi:RNA polymerase sigma-70 factor, ECF subfamily